MAIYQMRIDTSDESLMRDALMKYREHKVVDFLGLRWVVQEVEAKYGEQAFVLHLVVTTRDDDGR